MVCCLPLSVALLRRSYERIGVAAPVVLVLLRCLQGIGFGETPHDMDSSGIRTMSATSPWTVTDRIRRRVLGGGAGGEYGGAVLLSYEYGPEQHAGTVGRQAVLSHFWPPLHPMQHSASESQAPATTGALSSPLSSVPRLCPSALLSCPPQVGGTLGASLSFALLAALQSSKHHRGMGWRVAFLLSLLLLVVGLYIRRRVEETPAFRYDDACAASAPSAGDSCRAWWWCADASGR